MATNTDPGVLDFADFPDNPADLTPEQRAAAAAEVLHQIERHCFLLQEAYQLLAVLCGLDERDCHRIAQEAIEEVGAEQDADLEDDAEN